MDTRTLDTGDAAIVYDVRGPLPPGSGLPPLLMVGQPMDARGFETLASLFPERTVVTYDPRGLGRSTRRDGSAANDPCVQADDLHALITELGGGPVEMFASSGGAVTALALVTRHPDDVSVLVAHEPPLHAVLRDADAARRALQRFHDAYTRGGRGAGMAEFVAMSSWRGPFTDEFFSRPPADPAQFGMPADDDGSRDDPLLSHSSDAVTAYEPDIEVLRASPARVVIAAGEESEGIFTGRASAALAELLGRQLAVFPSHHGGFMGGDGPYAGQPEAFARRLREVLAG